MELFNQFWQLYPARNGKKIGKAIAQRVFDKFSPEDKQLCIKAVIHYANCKMVRQGIGIRDANRFLYDRLNKHEYWREWLEPESITPVMPDIERDKLKTELKSKTKMLERCKTYLTQAEEFKPADVPYWQKSIKAIKAEIDLIAQKLK